MIGSKFNTRNFHDLHEGIRKHNNLLPSFGGLLSFNSAYQNHGVSVRTKNTLDRHDHQCENRIEQISMLRWLAGGASYLERYSTGFSSPPLYPAMGSPERPHGHDHDSHVFEKGNTRFITCQIWF
jgi:hypothetical protein